MMAENPNLFKAFVLSEMASMRREMAENARAAKLRKTDEETESTNSGGSVQSNRSSTPDDLNGGGIFATPLDEQPPEIRPLLEQAVALVGEGKWSRSACQRYFAALRQHCEPNMLQPTRLESLSFLQLQELCAKLQLPPLTDYKGMNAAREAISRKRVGVNEYFVACYLAEQTAHSLKFLGEQSNILGSGAVIQHVSRAVVTTSMVISPVVFYDWVDGQSVMSLSYRTISLDDESLGYAKMISIRKVLVNGPAPRVPHLEMPAPPARKAMWLPTMELAKEFEEGARQQKCFMKTEALERLAAEAGVHHEGLRREQIIDNLAAWASKACLLHVEAQLRSGDVCEVVASPQAPGHASPNP